MNNQNPIKHSKATLRLYESDKLIALSMRIPVRMKESIDVDILKRAVNEAIKRYPYFAVKVDVDEDGAYVLLDNDAEIAVIPYSDKTPLFGSSEVNEHLCFVEYEEKTIHFNMSHSLCGGKGVQPWVMTTIYQYVKDKYDIIPDAPLIRKPGESFLDGEIEEPTLAMLSDEEPIYKSKSKKPVMMLWDYINGLFNPFMRDPNYYVFTFKQENIIAFGKENDTSVVAFFMIMIAKMLDRILPKKHNVIGAEVSHNPSNDIGLPYSHFDMHSMIYVDYERDMFKWDLNKLGTMTRGQIYLQKDSSVSNYQLRKVFEFHERIESVKGLKNKKAFVNKNSPSRSKDARHSTFVCNYSGYVDWGEVANYIDNYAIVVDGSLVFEVTSLGDKIMLAFMQLVKSEKYVKALREQFDEMNIPYEIEGPYPKRLAKHKLPSK